MKGGVMSRKNYTIKIYSKIGLVVHLSQMIEYNLANIFAFNEILEGFKETDSMYLYEYNQLAQKANEWYESLNKMELGRSLKQFKGTTALEKELISRIDKVRIRRNYYIHNFFKEDLKTQRISSNSLQLMSDLEALIEEMASVNDQLCVIFNQYKAEYKMID